MIQKISFSACEPQSVLRHLSMAVLLSSAIAAGAFAATPESVTAQGPALADQKERISDTIIYRDHGVYRDTQQRIKARNDAGRSVADYQLSKAQCWLDVSFHEYSRNDRGNFPQAALDESQRILLALENKQDPGLATPLVNGAEKLRPDLWARYDTLKTHRGFQCAAQQTACAEVELVHAGNEIREASWRHAKPYIQIAEDLTGAAEKAAEACLPAPVAAIPVVLPAPVLAPTKMTLSADALFDFDKSGSADLLPKGRAELDQLAEKITKNHVGIGGLMVIGYTDRLGKAAYNQRLSLARANTVKAYLERSGVTLPITTQGHGQEGQVEACDGVKPMAALITCLAPNRRVEVLLHESAKP